MSLSTADAVPYFYAAGVQVMTTVSNYIASAHTKAHFDGLLLVLITSVRPLENGGYVEKGTREGSVIPAHLAPDAVLKYASRDRDFGSVVISIVLVLAPVLLTSTQSKLDAQLKILALIAVLFLCLSIFLVLRRVLSDSKGRLQFIGTYLAAVLAVAINIGAGTYLMFQPPTVPSVPVAP